MTNAPRILVVDDSPANRLLLEMMIRKFGGEPVSVAGGLPAVAAVEAGDLDLVLMDLNMPDIDGIEATRRIRAIAGDRGMVPVVAVTAYETEEHRDQVSNCGLDGFVTKPVSMPVLRETLERILGKSE